MIKSTLQGMDNYTRWLDDYYFYEHFKLQITAIKIITSIILTLIIIITLLGNILVCIAFCRYRRLRVITNYFVLSLAISDILVGCLSMPLFLSYELTEWRKLPSWIDGMKLYQFLEVVDILCCVSSIANLTAISIDRFFGIVKPLKHKTFMTETIALTCIFFVWVYSFTIAITKLIPHFTHYVVFNFIAGFALPLIIISGAYVFIFLTVKKHSKRKLSNVMAQEWMLARTILIVISLFVIGWAPFYVVQLLYQYCLTCGFVETNTFDHIVSTVKLLHYCNSCCNPFVYGYFNVSFKQAFKSVFKNWLHKKKYRDVNSNINELSLATGYSTTRKRSPSGFSSLLSEVDKTFLNDPLRKISPVSLTNNQKMFQPMIEHNNDNMYNYAVSHYTSLEFQNELKFVNKALELVNNLTLGALHVSTNNRGAEHNEIKTLNNNYDVSISRDRFSDNLQNILTQSSTDIDCLLADAKESDL